MRTMLRGKVTLLFMMLGLLLAVPAIALADNAVADGDGLTPIALDPQNNMSFGNVGCNVESSKNALVAVTRNGSATGTNTFANSAEVTVTVQSVSGAGLSAAMDSNPSKITLPSNWTGLDNNKLSDSVSSTVKVNSSTPGLGSGKVTYAATGKNTSGDTITRTDEMTVSWNTGSCDTQAPSVTSISTANTNPTNTTDPVSWTVTFSENVSGVDAGDFALTGSGLGGSPAISSVTPAPADQPASVYTVTASSGTGSGILGLDLNDNDSIVDGASNKLGGQGTGTAAVTTEEPGDGSFDGDDYVIDRVAPTVTPTALKGVDPDYTDGAYSEGAWTNKDVQVTFTCVNDTGGSGLTSTSDNDVQAYTTQTSAIGTTATFGSVTGATCEDEAGNSATSDLSFGPIKIDKTAPTVQYGSPAQTNLNYSATGWFNASQVPVSSPLFTADDGLSGLDFAGSGLTSPTKTFTLQVSDESTKVNNVVVPTSTSKTVKDLAGNQTVQNFSAQIDKTNPSLGITDPNTTTTFDVCGTARPVKPTPDPTDALSDILTDSLTETWTTSSGLGPYTYKASVKDNALNTAYYPGPTATEVKTYSVVPGSAYSGFLQPINASAQRSSFKLGSTVPVKFTLSCNGTPINSVVKLYLSNVDNSGDPVNEAVSTNAPDAGNTFRLTDATTGQYQFNLSTKAGYTFPGPNNTTVTLGQGTWYLWLKFDSLPAFQAGSFDVKK